MDELGLTCTNLNMKMHAERLKILYFPLFRDRKGVLYSMYAVGAHGSAEYADKVKTYKKAMKLTSPVHKRTRILFDDILANATKKGRKGSQKKGGRLLSLGELLPFTTTISVFSTRKLP